MTEHETDPTPQTPLAETEPAASKEPRGPDIQAELAKRDEQIAALTERLEKSEAASGEMKAALEKAGQEVAEAKATAQQERERRERLIYIEKAQTYDQLSVQAEELGEFLHFLSKQDAQANIEKAEDAEDRSQRLEYLETLLKAVNEQLKTASIYKEAGTTRYDAGPDDIVSKARAAVEAGKYETVKDALLHLTPEDLNRHHAAQRQLN